MQVPSYISGCTEKIIYTVLHSLSVYPYQHEVVSCRVGVLQSFLIHGILQHPLEDNFNQSLLACLISLLDSYFFFFLSFFPFLVGDQNSFDIDTNFSDFELYTKNICQDMTKAVFS